jgi:hypothetical protein
MPQSLNQWGKIVWGLLFILLVNEISIVSPTLASANSLERILTRSKLAESRLKLAQIQPNPKFEKFSVGVNIGKVNVLAGTSVLGKTDGSRAIDLPRWLLSYQDLVEGLKLKVKTLPDGQLEIRTPSLVTRIDPKQLQIDPDLGLVLSIDDLSRLFGIKAEFDIVEYAINLTVPWQGQSQSENSQESVEAPINFDGLPRINHPEVALSSIQQLTTLVGGAASPTSAQGELAAIGSFWNYSGYIKVNQPNLLAPQTWNLNQLQFAKQTDFRDWMLGSQAPFWRSQGSGDYWGITTVSRDGFRATPPSGGEVNLQQRLQSPDFGNTIIGEAPLGTLVRLTEGFRDISIAEVLVDASGQYRFENLKGSNYRLLLYPKGQLNVLPEVRNASFSQVFGQIPKGTSATLLSGGIGRQLDGSNFWGRVSDVRGGVARRWGISDDLTVGLGAIYDRSFQGLGELFWRPHAVPMRISLSTLMGNAFDFSSTIDYQPTSNLNVNLSIDRLSTRLRTNWQLANKLSLTATYDPKDVGNLVAQYSSSNRDSYTFASASFDTAQRLRWYLQQRWGVFQLSNQGSEQRTIVEASYDFAPNVSISGGSSIVASYELSNLQSPAHNALTNLVWRYRSPAIASDGANLWETELGYGIGSLNQGVFASAGMTVLPGLMLRGSYQGAAQNGASAFRLELVSNLNLSSGVHLGDRQIDTLRTHGGMILQPFFDRNANGNRDSGEESHVEDLDLLVSINQRPIQTFRPDLVVDGISVRVMPGNYRIDFDPAGFPSEWQTDKDAVAVDVAAGAYTIVPIPLIRSFTRSGIATTTLGKTIDSARIEAIRTDRQFRVLSISNSQGLFTLQGLRVGKYRLEINGKQVDSIEISPTSPSQATLNLNL